MRCPRRCERGFTLLEAVAAIGIWVVLGSALLFATRSLFSSARLMVAQRDAYLQLTRLVESLEAESTSALTIFVPASDVLGSGNGDGHEVDFYSRDAARYGHFWAYRWDRATSTLQRYTYTAPGSAATASDPPLTGITAFTAARKLASAVALPYLAGYSARDVRVNFGYPGVDGGNAITTIGVSNAQTHFSVELLAGTMTSGFQVVVATFTPTPVPTPPPTLAPTAPPQTPTPVPQTPLPSATPAPPPTSTPLPAPTATPPPSATPAPTATPSPTTAPTAAPPAYTLEIVHNNSNGEQCEVLFGSTYCIPPWQGEVFCMEWMGSSWAVVWEETWALYSELQSSCP